MQLSCDQYQFNMFGPNARSANQPPAHDGKAPAKDATTTMQNGAAHYHALTLSAKGIASLFSAGTAVDGASVFFKWHMPMHAHRIGKIAALGRAGLP